LGTTCGGDNVQPPQVLHEPERRLSLRDRVVFDEMKKTAYPIRAVSKLTGISIDNLCAWERRYKAIEPSRSDRGRVYEEADVERLILLRQAVERGHAISKLAVLSNRELEDLNTRSAALSRRPVDIDAADANPTGTTPDLTVLHDAIRRLSYHEIDAELNRMAALLPARNLIHQVVVPLMTELGDQWYRGDLSVAQEHMVSASLRNLAGSLVRLFTRVQPAKTLLFATPKGELHEFGILCAAMLAGAGGLGVAYLGVSLPSAEIIDAAKKTGAEVVVLGFKAAISSKDSLKELHRISEGIPVSTELWVGGIRSGDTVREIKTTRARYLRDLTILEQELVRLGARF